MQFSKNNMARVKVKKITKNMDADQETLTELFEQMTGVKDADPEIILPKYAEVMGLLRKLYRLYKLLSELDVFVQTFSEYVWVEEIKLFLQDMLEECKLEPDKEYSVDKINADIAEAKLNAEKAKEYINSHYRTVKASQVIKKVMITSANLAPFKHHLSAANPSDTFIRREPGNTFVPLAFTSLDLKLIWNYDVEPKCLKFILSILQHTYTISYNIYDVIYSPDVDIVQFSELLISTIAKLRKQIPRCDRAFDVIENSVNMLRTNFKDYFRMSVESENPATILESFIIDVASSQKANPSVVMQFRKITAFMKKNAGNNKDPRVQKLFKMLNMQFNKLDKEMNVDTSNAAEPEPEETTEGAKDRPDEPDHVIHADFAEVNHNENSVIDNNDESILVPDVATVEEM